ncbi:MAG: SRPBCC domain-containing protein [Woeseiaceae bacterium]|nr:SRPBCC domain-containing protein [Woeseiaceae bacterium]
MRGDKPGGPICWRLHIPVPPERVFDALNSDDGRAAFWAESARESDGHIEFRFVNGFCCRCRILERRRPTSFAVHYIGAPVRFELKPDGDGGTDLELTHDGVSDDEWQEVHAGWLNVLFPLKAFLAHGVDLRNHDPDRDWDRGYVDQ